MDSPNVDIQLIERVVREVLAALSGAAHASPQHAVAESPAQEPAGTEKERARQATSANTKDSPQRLARMYSTRDGELTLANKVVTVASLENRLAGIRQVVVPLGAIITPAARDMLAEKGIKVFFGSRSAESLKGEPRSGLVSATPVTIFLVTRRVSPQQLENLLRPEGIDAQYESLDCLVRASDRVAEVCQSKKLAVVVTRYVSAEVCLANRHRGVRAIGGWAGIDVAAETAAVGANALVADAAAGLFALKRMITAFVRAPHVCPESLRERLEQS
jgi:hypothetical protein